MRCLRRPGESLRHAITREFEAWRMRWFPYRWFSYEATPVYPVTNENILTAWTRRGWVWRGREFLVRENEAPR